MNFSKLIKNPVKNAGFFYLSLLALIASCTSSPKEEKKTVVRTMYKKPAAPWQDTLVITRNSAVFFTPDSLQWKLLKERIPGAEYENETHNCFFLVRNAKNVITAHYPRIKIIESSRARYLLFKKTNGQTSCIDLDSKGDMCGIFLFDGVKDPELTDMMNIETALGFYFQN